MTLMAQTRSSSPTGAMQAVTIPSVSPPGIAGWKDAVILSFLGLVTEAAYIGGFVLPYPLAGNYTHPQTDLNAINDHTPFSANAFALTWAVSFAAYYIA